MSLGARLCICILATVCSTALSCKAREPKIPAITGVVKVDGQPLAQADVQFYLVQGEVAKVIFGGRTDDRGRYRALNPQAGSYRVVVRKYVHKDGTPLSPDEDPSQFEFQPQLQANVKLAVPAEYADPYKTPLKAEVSGEDQTLDFDLKSK